MIFLILLLASICSTQSQTTNGQYVTTNQYSAVYSSNQQQYQPNTIQYNNGVSAQPIQYDQPIQNQNQNQMNQYQTSNTYNPQQNQVQGYSSNGYSNGNSQLSTQGSSSGNSSVSIMDYSFNNGNCQYKDGQIIENGQTRQATQSELQQIQTYRNSVDQYMTQVNSYVGSWISSVFQSLPSSSGSFPNVPTMPTMPQAPCLCSAQNCGNSTDTNSIGNTPQRDFYGNQMSSSNNQYQQNSQQFGQQNNMQYLQNTPQNSQQYQQNTPQNGQQNSMQYQQSTQQNNQQYQQNQYGQQQPSNQQNGYYGRRK